MKNTFKSLLAIGALSSSLSFAEQKERLQVTLVDPHPRNFGVIIIEGPKAKELYDALSATPTDHPEPVEGSIYGPSKRKTGDDYSCSESALDEKPEEKLYSCSLMFDFKAGKIFED